LPERIARELQQHDRVQPLEYDCATVLFTDFVGFTQIAERLTPQELIEELDGCFRHFDQIIRRHRLEKIKTIGDAYMAAGGISRATYEQVKDFFDCDYRGAIAAKNKGEIEMYFVNRIRPELSRDGAGQAPNEAFFALYERIEPGHRLAAGAPAVAE